MSPNYAEMAEIIETDQQTAPVVQVEESPVAVDNGAAGSVEPTLIRGLMQRVGAFTGAAIRVPSSRATSPMQGSELQEVIDRVSAQHDERGPPEWDGERCGVCAGSFGGRPRARCAGCSKRIHKIGCVTCVTVTSSLQAGMCNLCCNRVSEWMGEVREYSSNTSQRWREDEWLKRLVKSQSEGLALSHHECGPFNELQSFLWKALGQGLSCQCFSGV